MILEGLVSTIQSDGSPHIAPMGPLIEGNWSRILLRPFPTSHTYQNLVRHGEGVLHVTDDALLIARAAVGVVDPLPPFEPAQVVKGWIANSACRYYEFQVVSIDTSEERVRILADIVHSGKLREFFGFNRAKHAVLEAAILATRLHLFPRQEVESEYRRFRVIVEKTGGTDEQTAMTFLEEHLAKYQHERPGK